MRLSCPSLAGAYQCCPSLAGAYLCCPSLAGAYQEHESGAYQEHESGHGIESGLATALIMHVLWYALFGLLEHQSCCRGGIKSRR